jgi:hypothetical protein
VLSANENNIFDVKQEPDAFTFAAVKNEEYGRYILNKPATGILKICNFQMAPVSVRYFKQPSHIYLVSFITGIATAHFNNKGRCEE